MEYRAGPTPNGGQRPIRHTTEEGIAGREWGRLRFSASLPKPRHRPSGNRRVYFISPLNKIGRRKAWILPEQPAFTLLADDEHGRGGAVVGAGVGVFRDAPAEFAEGHHQHARQITLRFHIVDEGFHRIAQILQAAVAACSAWLVCVS